MSVSIHTIFYVHGTISIVIKFPPGNLTAIHAPFEIFPRKKINGTCPTRAALCFECSCAKHIDHWLQRKNWHGTDAAVGRMLSNVVGLCNRNAPRLPCLREYHGTHIRIDAISKREPYILQNIQMKPTLKPQITVALFATVLHSGERSDGKTSPDCPPG